MPDPRTRLTRWMPALRVGFLLAVGLFAWLGLRGRWDEVGEALADTSLLGALGALVLVLIGLTATGILWLLLMRCFDARLPYVDGSAIFFMGQLGKYIPGSVWSIGAQAEMARRHQVPPRATAAAGLLFLGYHVDTAVLIASVALLTGGLDSSWPDWVWWLGLLGGLIGLVPGLVAWLGRRIGGRAVRLDWARTGAIVVLMGITWAMYALALVLLLPGRPWSDVFVLGGAFAAAYAVGVVIVFAPAGVGARETVFVLLLTPLLGVGPATALALLARVVHTAADGLAAGGWWWAARGDSRRAQAAGSVPAPVEGQPAG